MYTFTHTHTHTTLIKKYVNMRKITAGGLFISSVTNSQSHVSYSCSCLLQRLSKIHVYRNLHFCRHVFVDIYTLQSIDFQGDYRGTTRQRTGKACAAARSKPVYTQAHIHAIRFQILRCDVFISNITHHVQCLNSDKRARGLQGLRALLPCHAGIGEQRRRKPATEKEVTVSAALSIKDRCPSTITSFIVTSHATRAHSLLQIHTWHFMYIVDASG